MKSCLKFLECCSDFISLATVFYVSTRQFFSFLTSFYQCFLGKPIYAMSMYRHVGVTGQVALNEYLKQVSNLKWSVKLCFGKVHFDASIHRSGRVRDFQNGVSKIFRLRYLFILHRIFFVCCAAYLIKIEFCTLKKNIFRIMHLSVVFLVGLKSK